MQGGYKSLLLRSRGCLERPDVFTVVRFRHKKKRYPIPGRAPVVSSTKMMEMAYHQSKAHVRKTKPKWYDYFPGREPLPKYYISRPKPDWRRFSIDKILEFSKVIPEVSFRNKLLYWIENGAWLLFRLGLIAAGGWLFRMLFFFPSTLGGPSMLPTFNSGSTGDIVLIGTYGARRRGYEIGDVVVARPPDPKKQNPGKRVLKRIRAMEGDTIILDDKTEFMMPKDHFWLQGDNPHRSFDSRMYGPVSIDNIVGKVIFRLYPNVSVLPDLTV